MGNGGKFGWRPAYLEDEIKDIMREERISKESNAILKLVEHARAGREVHRAAMSFLLAPPRKQKPLKLYKRR